MKNNFSIKDIAKMAGVSVSTVSKVIHHKGKISAKTSARVNEIIAETGYNPNPIAQGLRNKNTHTVGILVPNLSNYYFANVVESIESGFSEKGYSTIICDTLSDPDKELSELKMLSSKMVDAVVVISGLKAFNTQDLIGDIPIVCIDRKLEDENVYYIGSDHYKGGQLATQKLIDAGTIPYIFMSPRESSSATERLQGYKDTLQKNHVSFKQDMIFKLSSEQDKTIETRRLAIRNFLRKRINGDLKRPLGFFALSDRLAADLIISAESFNLSVPEDFKVIGFDDALIANYCKPALTTIRQNTDELASRTVRYILNSFLKSNEYLEKSGTERVPVELIQRGTV